MAPSQKIEPGTTLVKDECTLTLSNVFSTNSVGQWLADIGSANLVPRVFVPYCACWLDETFVPNRWSKGTKTLGTRVHCCVDMNSYFCKHMHMQTYHSPDTIRGNPAIPTNIIAMVTMTVSVLSFEFPFCAGSS